MDLRPITREELEELLRSRPVDVLDALDRDGVAISLAEDGAAALEIRGGSADLDGLAHSLEMTVQGARVSIPLRKLILGGRIMLLAGATSQGRPGLAS